MANEKSLLETNAGKILRVTAELHTKTAQMLYAFTHGHIHEAYEMALENEREAERMILAYRDIPICMGHPSAEKDVQAIMSEEIPVEMGFTEEGWFVLRIPKLLPRKEKSKGSYKYIRGYLYPALDRYFNHEFPKCFEKCVIIYRHIYDRNRPDTEYRDHDNIEVNFVTDAVAMYVMVDDSALRCQHYYCSAPGDHERTEVYVIPEHDFMKWYQASKTIPEEGVKILDSASLFERKDVQKQGKIPDPDNGRYEKGENPLQF